MLATHDPAEQARPLTDAEVLKLDRTSWTSISLGALSMLSTPDGVTWTTSTSFTLTSLKQTTAVRVCRGENKDPQNLDYRRAKGNAHASCCTHSWCLRRSLRLEVDEGPGRVGAALHG